MTAKQMTRTGAVARMLMYTAAGPIAFVVIAVVYALISGGNG